MEENKKGHPRGHFVAFCNLHFYLFFDMTAILHIIFLTSLINILCQCCTAELIVAN